MCEQGLKQKMEQHDFIDNPLEVAQLLKEKVEFRNKKQDSEMKPEDPNKMNILQGLR